jgi:hypothetical protein
MHVERQKVDQLSWSYAWHYETTVIMVRKKPFTDQYERRLANGRFARTMARGQILNIDLMSWQEMTGNIIRFYPLVDALM